MKQRKLYMLLGTLLVIGCLVAAIGITFARYRTQWNGHMGFHAEQVGRLHLGTVSGDTFSNTQAEWTQTQNGWQMDFAVANGLRADDHTALNQQVQLQLVASLGAWDADSEETITLTVEGKTYTATASSIPQNSTLHTQFGDGWVFRFQDESGNAYTGQLPGGTFGYIPMQLSINSTAITDTGLFQLQAIAEIQ